MAETTEMIKAIANDSKVRIDRIVTNYEQLEKENEKLDKQIDTMLEDCKRCTYRKTSEQLEQAKEIIKELLDTQSQLDPYRDIFKNRILKAEQFLKEIEK